MIYIMKKKELTILTKDATESEELTRKIQYEKKRLKDKQNAQKTKDTQSTL